MANLLTKAVNTVKLALTTKNKISQDFATKFASAALRPERIKEIDAVINKLLPGRSQYETVATILGNGIPWYFILMIHAMEAGAKSQPFNFHLHCGDPLTARTIHIPVGRPLHNPGHGTKSPSFINPYSWKESAIDALKLLKLDMITDWSIGNCLRLQEQFNGMGYRRMGVPSPYIWSYTNVYTKGKYVADGKYDPNAVSKQPGCAAYLIRLRDTHVLF